MSSCPSVIPPSTCTRQSRCNVSARQAERGERGMRPGGPAQGRRCEARTCVRCGPAARPFPPLWRPGKGRSDQGGARVHAAAATEGMLVRALCFSWVHAAAAGPCAYVPRLPGHVALPGRRRQARRGRAGKRGWGGCKRGWGGCGRQARLGRLQTRLGRLRQASEAGEAANEAGEAAAGKRGWGSCDLVLELHLARVVGVELLLQLRDGVVALRQARRERYHDVALLD